jgi:hypothetical protein
MIKFFLQIAFREKLFFLFVSLSLISTLLALSISGIDIGEEQRLFSSVTVALQGFLLNIFAVFYSLHFLGKEKRGGLFIVPLSIGVSRNFYFLSLLISISLLLLFQTLLFIVPNLIAILLLGFSFELITHTLLLSLSASLLATLILVLAQYSSTIKATIYSIIIFFIGNGLDELYFYAYKLEPDRNLQLLFEIVSLVVPNFYLFEEFKIEALFHFLIFSTFLYILGSLKFRSRVLRVEE